MLKNIQKLNGKVKRLLEINYCDKYPLTNSADLIELRKEHKM